jgi:hypothetical protein
MLIHVENLLLLHISYVLIQGPIFAVHSSQKVFSTYYDDSTEILQHR